MNDIERLARAAHVGTWGPDDIAWEDAPEVARQEWMRNHSACRETIAFQGILRYISARRRRQPQART